MTSQPTTPHDHAERLAAHAAAGARRDGRVGAVAAVNDRLRRPGAVPRPLHHDPGRALWRAAVNRVLRDHGWPEAADHEFHPAPDRSLPTTPARPDTPAHRPDPWRWTTAHAISRAACQGTVHRVVFDRGRITHPDHPDGTWQTAACHRSPHLRAVKDAQDAAGPLRYFTPTWFTDHEVETVPWEEAAMHWGPVPDLHPDADDDRFCQRRAATRHDDDLHEAVFPPVQHLVLHDPLRPDLTGITAGRGTGLPDGAWWQAPGTLHLTVCLSAWWPLEVAARPWHHIQSLTALDVLAWDLERCAPHQMLLLDWTDDPAARLLHQLGPWVEETGGPLAPVLLRAEVTDQPDGTWHITAELDRTPVTAP
ncbi:hypothetical protein ACGRHY_26370 [Streptomyces sp. HK10]|uniref:hypothetical protein n=1 Tax=Streptomyces sp. HK10 TaxID=3373255 RepID=UPI00374A82A2